MPLSFQRLPPAGFQERREVAEKLNGLGDATAGQIAALESRLDLLETLIVALKVAGNGAMSLRTPEAGADITGTFQAIDHYDTVDIPGVLCTLDEDAGTITFDNAGIWLILFSINISHNESNSGRETNIRLFEVTDSIAGQTEPIAIARNQPGTNYSASILVDIASSNVGDTFRCESGGGDTLTTVNWNSVSFDASYMGALGGLIEPGT